MERIALQHNPTLSNLSTEYSFFCCNATRYIRMFIDFFKEWKRFEEREWGILSTLVSVALQWTWNSMWIWLADCHLIFQYVWYSFPWYVKATSYFPITSTLILPFKPLLVMLPIFFVHFLGFGQGFQYQHNKRYYEQQGGTNDYKSLIVSIASIISYNFVKGKSKPVQT